MLNFGTLNGIDYPVHTTQVGGLEGVGLAINALSRDRSLFRARAVLCAAQVATVSSCLWAPGPCDEILYLVIHPLRAPSTRVKIDISHNDTTPPHPLDPSSKYPFPRRSTLLGEYGFQG